MPSKSKNTPRRQQISEAEATAFDTPDEMPPPICFLVEVVVVWCGCGLLIIPDSGPLDFPQENGIIYIQDLGDLRDNFQWHFSFRQ